MAKQRIWGKGPPMGSLARRTLLTALLLLVVPLLAHTYYLYRAEYREELGDVAQDLKTLAAGQSAWLQEKIAYWKLSLGLEKEAAVEIRLVEEGAVLEIEAPGEAVFSTPVKEILESISAVNVLPYPVEVRLVLQGTPLSPPPKSIAWETPIGDTGLALQLMVDQEKVAKLHRYGVGHRMLSLLLLVGVFGGALVWILVWRLAKPLKALCRVMYQVSQGEIQARYTHDRMGFEIDTIGQQFNQTLDAVLSHEEEAARQRLLKERLEQQLAIGREIQAGLVPRHLEVEGLHSVSGFVPAQEVSGDFFDALPRKDGKTFFVIADAAGKGISACLYSLVFRSILRTLAALGKPLEEILKEANALFFLDAEESGMFATVWAALWDPKTCEITYASQGHPPALLLTSQGVEEMKTEGAALGFASSVEVSPQKRTLSSEDLLLLYTDGIIEAHDRGGKRYGAKRLAEFLEKQKRLPLEEIAKMLQEEIFLYANEAGQHDDITFLALRSAKK